MNKRFEFLSTSIILVYILISVFVSIKIASVILSGWLLIQASIFIFNKNLYYKFVEFIGAEQNKILKPNRLLNISFLLVLGINGLINIDSLPSIESLQSKFHVTSDTMYDVVSIGIILIFVFIINKLKYKCKNIMEISALIALFAILLSEIMFRFTIWWIVNF